MPTLYTFADVTNQPTPGHGNYPYSVGPLGGFFYIPTGPPPPPPPTAGVDAGPHMYGVVRG